MNSLNFKRNIYYQTLRLLELSNVVFLLGPRKCGKTFALRQIDEDCSNIQYVDFKLLSKEQSMDTVNALCSNILSGAKVTYLLDEVTHAFFPEVEIAKIASTYTEAKQRGVDVQTKLVLAGSQSVALEAWGRRAFCNQAMFLKADFLSYSEWLKFKGREDVTAQSYQDFLSGTSEFYHFTTVEEYLRGCLDETVVSNANSRNYIYGNDVELVEIDTLMDILYLCLFSLHDNLTSQAFFKKGALSDKLIYIARQIEHKNPMCPEEVRAKVAQSFVGRYDNVQATDMETLKQCFSFLMRCGLVTATPVFPDFEQDNLNVLKHLENDTGMFRKKSDLLGRVNFTINYPMFFVEIVNEILNGSHSKDLTGMLVGSILECHIRGLLPSSGSYEYRDELGREIDYINRRDRKSVEITISNKNTENVHLNLIPDSEGYQKILLSRDIQTIRDGIEMIPYYEYVYELEKRR